MTKVFLSGSRSLGRLNDAIRARLENLVNQKLTILIGDANGADKAFQAYFVDHQYNNVEVFCSGSTCRNNLGSWRMKNIDAPKAAKGREFYTAKDKEMAKSADYGFVVWDGKSSGSIANVFEMLKYGKPTVVYVSPKRNFLNIKSLEDAVSLLSLVDEKTRDSISQKAKLPQSISAIESSKQGALAI